jgi:hypothetical protein
MIVSIILPLNMQMEIVCNKIFHFCDSLDWNLSYHVLLEGKILIILWQHEVMPCKKTKRKLIATAKRHICKHFQWNQSLLGSNVSSVQRSQIYIQDTCHLIIYYLVKFCVPSASILNTLDNLWQLRLVKNGWVRTYI